MGLVTTSFHAACLLRKVIFHETNLKKLITLLKQTLKNVYKSENICLGCLLLLVLFSYNVGKTPLHIKRLRKVHSELKAGLGIPRMIVLQLRINNSLFNVKSRKYDVLFLENKHLL